MAGCSSVRHTYASGMLRGFRFFGWYTLLFDRIDLFDVLFLRIVAPFACITRSFLRTLCCSHLAHM